VGVRAYTRPPASAHTFTRTSICARIECMHCGRIALVVCARARPHYKKKMCLRAGARPCVNECVFVFILAYGVHHAHALFHARMRTWTRRVTRLKFVFQSFKVQDSETVVTVIAKEDAASDVRCEFEYSQKSLNCFRWSSELERERERERKRSYVLCS
jgi:hypothetical protein